MPTNTSSQDYLKAIYSIAQSGSEATTTVIAQRMGVRPASVTAMVKRLAAKKLVRHRPYRGVELTPAGTRLALEVIRHHRLLESYLHDVMGMGWERIHDEAEVLEHAISEEFEDRIAEMLGHPTHDPHGDPIPPKAGAHTETLHPSLVDFGSGAARVERVSDRDPEALRYLGSIGLLPGALIKVEKAGPFGSPVWVRIRSKRHAIGRELASSVYVSAAGP